MEDINSYLNNLKNEYLNFILDRIEIQDYDRYMDMCYNSLITFPDELINYDNYDSTMKIKILDKIIKHFEDKEEYEKCSKLKEIQNMIIIKYENRS